MDWMILGIFLALNMMITFLMHRLQNRALDRRLHQVRQEIEVMEDLVAAMIAELEEATADLPKLSAENGGAKAPDQAVGFDEASAVIDSSEGYQPQFDSKTTEEPVNTPQVDFSMLEAEPLEEIEVSESESVVSSAVLEPEVVQGLAPKYQQILELHRQGEEVEEIAKQLGLGRGEVQLILGLYQRS